MELLKWRNGFVSLSHTLYVQAHSAWGLTKYGPRHCVIMRSKFLSLKHIYHKCPTCRTTLRTAITQEYVLIIIIIIWWPHAYCKSKFGLTIKDTGSTRLDVNQFHSSVALWRQLADSPCCLQALLLVFICSFENRKGLRREIRASAASINGHPVEVYSSRFTVSTRETVKNHSDCLTVGSAG